MPTRGSFFAFTLIEVLVVIAVIGVLLSFTVPNISTWSCRQELETDYRKINDFLESVRQQAYDRNQTLMVYYSPNYSPNEGRFITREATKSCRNKSPSNDPNMYLAIDKNQGYKINQLNKPPLWCFRSDGSAISGNLRISISKQCGDVNYTFITSLLTATGMLEKSSYKFIRLTMKFDRLM